MGKAQPITRDIFAQVAAFKALEGDIHDLMQMCRVVDHLREEATTDASTGITRLHSGAWERIEFASFQCTLRAKHLVARWDAAHEGIETTDYGASPRHVAGEEP